MIGLRKSMTLQADDDDLTKIRISERNLIIFRIEQQMLRFIACFYVDFNKIYIPLMELSYDKSFFDQDMQKFMENSDIFEVISPVFKVYLLDSAYVYINRIGLSKEVLFTIQDFMKGRFDISEVVNDYSLMIIPQFKSHLNLNGIIMVNSENVIPEIFLYEACKNQQRDQIEKISNILSSKMLNLTAYGSLLENALFLGGPKNYSPKQNHLLLNIQRKEESFQWKKREEINRLKENIKKKCAKSNQNLNWIDFLVNYHKGPDQNEPEIYEGLEQKWKLVFFNDFLVKLKNEGEDRFTEYFSKIIHHSQGFVFEDARLISKLGSFSLIKKYLVVPITMAKTKLCPILAVLYFDTNEKVMPRLGVLNWWTHESFYQQLKIFETQMTSMRIGTVFGRTNIKFLVAYQQNRIIPLKDLEMKSAGTNTIVFFVCCFTGICEVRKFIIQSQENKINAEIVGVYKENNSKIIYISKFTFPKSSQFKISVEVILKSSKVWIVDEKADKRSSGEKEFCFLFDVSFKDFGGFGYNQVRSILLPIYSQLSSYCQYILENPCEKYIYRLDYFYHEYIRLKNPKPKNDTEFLNKLKGFINKSIPININKLFILLSMLSLSISLPFNSRLEQSEMLFDYYLNHGPNIEILKSKSYYELILSGLVKIIISLNITGGILSQILNNIYDEIILNLMLVNFINEFKKNNRHASIDQCNILIEQGIRLQDPEKSYIVSNAFLIFPDLSTLTQFIIQKTFEIDIKGPSKDVLTNYIKSVKITNKQLLQFLIFFKENNKKCEENFNLKDLKDFLFIHFAEETHLKEESEIIGDILIKMSEIEYFKNILQENEIKKVILQNFSIVKGLQIIKYLNADIYEFFKSYLKIKHPSLESGSIENLKECITLIKTTESIVENLDELIQSEICKSTVQLINQNLYVKLLETFNTVQCKYLKINYMNQFKEIIPKNKKLRIELIDFCENQKITLSSFIKEIYIYAVTYFCSSEEDLFDHLIEDPIKCYKLTKFLSRENLYKFEKEYQKIINYLQKYYNSIISKELNLKETSAICAHKKEGRNTLIKLMNIALKKTDNDHNLLRSLNEIEKTFTILKKGFRMIKKLHYKLPISRSCTSNIVEFLENFNKDLYICTSRGESLIQSIERVLDPIKINTSYEINSIVLYSNKSNFENSKQLQEYYRNFINHVKKINNKNETLKITDVEAFLIYLSRDKDIIKESNIISEVIKLKNFSDPPTLLMSTKGKQTDSDIKKFFESFKQLNTIKVLISSFKSYLENLTHNNKFDIKDLEIPKSYHKNFEDFCSNFIGNYLKNIDEKQTNSLAVFFGSLSECCNTYKLIIGLQENELRFWQECNQEIRNFHEFNNEKNDYQRCIQKNKDTESINQLIYKLLTVRRFVQILPHPEGELNQYFIDLITLLKKNENIIEDISFCESNYYIIEEYKKRIEGNQQVELKKIELILSKSSFEVSYNEKVSIFEIILLIIKDNNQPISIKLYELGDIREAIHLTVSTSKNSSIKKDSNFNIEQDFKIFTEFVDSLNSYIEILSQLNLTLMRLDFIDKKCFKIVDKKYPDFEKELARCNSLLKDWENGLDYFCKNEYYNNFLNNYRLIMIDNYLLKPHNENFQKVKNILQYMKKNYNNFEELKESYSKIEKSENSNTCKEKLNKFFSTLNSLLPYRNEKLVKLQDPDKKESIRTNLIYLVDTKEYYRAILTIYQLYDSFSPSSDIIYFCYPSTSWQDITMFINRLFLDENRRIYTLVYPENLNIEIQQKFEPYILSKYKSSEGKILSIVTKFISSKIVKGLIVQKQVCIKKIYSYSFLNNEQIKSIICDLEMNVELVTSQRSGLGKSTHIYQSFSQIKKLKPEKSLIHVDFSGNYNNEDLGLILERESVKENYDYHIQITSNNDSEYFDHFVFSLLIFGQFYTQKSLFILGKSKIYLEIANSVENNLFESIQILKFIPIHTKLIEFNYKEELILSKDIRYIAKYLYNYQNNLTDKEDIDYNQFEANKFEEINDENIYKIFQNQFINDDKFIINFHQFNTLIRILSTLFKNFEKSPFSAMLMNEYQNDFEYSNHKNLYDGFRSSIIKSILITTEEFIKKSTWAAYQTQILSYKSEALSSYYSENFGDFSIKWSNSNHFIVLFLKDGDFMSIYRDASKVDESIKKMILTQKLFFEMTETFRYISEYGIMQKILKNPEKILEYSELSSSQLIEILLNFYIKFSFHKNKSVFKCKNPEELINKRLSKLSKSGYVLTPDNFLKMNLIYLRCISGVPVILMGETGCGKTALLRFFIEEILREKLEILYIHIGITVEMIREKIKEAHYFLEKSMYNRVWFFFDEFNTSELIGLIANVLCERKFENLKLNDNLIFVGACNPYRANLKNNVQHKENVGIEKIQNTPSKLVHSVKPLPDKVLEFIWDFGALKDSELKEYVASMLNSAKIMNDSIFVNLICSVHQYFQERDDISSVSLRDVNRFIALNDWFKKSIEERSKNKLLKPTENYRQLHENLERSQILKIQEGILAFFHCYYLRLSASDQRKELLTKVLKIIRENHFDNIDENLLSDLLKFHQLDFVLRMEIPEGISMNQALVENIFAIIPCLMNKIPILICGKPGSSKSLAVQIISSSLKGIDSTDEYLKTLPPIQMFSFQGSKSSTSEDIEEIFSKALRFTHDKNSLPVVLFDEIGLAEQSLSNPLKALHRLLEIENNKVGFIALSNWRLDFSKMNRALYLARPDPEIDDLKQTALDIIGNTIGPSLDQMINGYKNLKDKISKKILPDFYGLRDFYHMIKYIKSNQTENCDLRSLVFKAIKKNFNGFKNYNPIISDCFKFLKNSENIPVSQLIKENLIDDKDSRYLMIICEPELSRFITSEIIENYFPKCRKIMGSTFEDDNIFLNSRIKRLLDITEHMKNGNQIILYNMNDIYTSLYNLFNQSFTKFDSRKYCQIALGSKSFSNCLVNDMFKVIVFINSSEEQLKLIDPPFLNRFEKHYINQNDIIDKEMKEKITELNKWVTEMMKIKEKDNLLDPVIIFPCYSKETLNLLVRDKTIDSCKQFLIENSSIDLSILIHMNSDDNYLRKWEEYHNQKFFDYIKSLFGLDNDYKKIICVTYDKTNSDTLLRDLEGITVQYCNSFKSEKAMKESLKEFFGDQTKRIYLLDLEFVSQKQHLLFIVNLINHIYHDESRNIDFRNKSLMILIRMGRNDTNREPLHYFKGWTYKFFENMQRNQFDICKELLQLNMDDIITEENYFIFEENIKDISEKAFSTIKYSSRLHSYEEIINYQNRIQAYLFENNTLIDAFKAKIKKSLKRLNSNPRTNFKLSLFSNKSLINRVNSIADAVKDYIYEIFLTEFIKIIIICEEKLALSQILLFHQFPEFSKRWIEFFDMISTESLEVLIIPNENHIKYYGQILTPYEFNKILPLFEKHTEDDWNNLKSIFDIEPEDQFKNAFIEYTLINKPDRQKYLKTISLFSMNSQNSEENLFSLSDNVNWNNKFFNVSQSIILSLYKILKLYSEYAQNGNEQVQFGDDLESFCQSLVKKVKSSAIISRKEINQELFSIKVLIIIESLNTVYPNEIIKNDLLIFEHAMATKNDKIIDFVYNTDINIIFRKECFEENKQFIGTTNDELRFKSFYMNEILKNDSSFLQTLILELTDEKYLLYFRDSLIDSVLKTIGVHNIISLIEREDINESELDEYVLVENFNDDESKVLPISIDINSKLALLLCFKIRSLNENDHIANYPRVEKIFKFYIDVFDRTIEFNDEYKNLMIIFSVGRLCNFLKTLASIQLDDAKGIDIIIETKFKDLLKRSKNSTQLEIYLLKELKALSNESFACLSQKIKKTEIEIKEIELPSDQKSYIIPYKKTGTLNYQELIKILENIENNQNGFDELYRIPNFKLLFGILIINKVYIKHPFENGNIFANWFKIKEHEFLEHFGKFYTNFIKKLIFNFDDELFSFSRGYNFERSIKSIEIIVSILIFLSYQGVKNPLCSLIFENGEPVDDIEARVNSIYVIGAEESLLLDLTKYSIENFELLKSPDYNSNEYLGGTYKCSETCEYLHIINHYGLSRYSSKCPICHTEIEVTIKNKYNHQNYIKDEDAKIYLKKNYEHLIAKQAKGFRIYNKTCAKSAPREMKSLFTFYILNFCVHSIFYFLIIYDLDEKGKIQSLYHIDKEEAKKKICELITRDFDFITEKKSNESLPSGVYENIHFKILASLFKLTETIEECQEKPYNDEIRRTFEKNFESKLNLNQSSTLINDYKLDLYKTFSHSDLLCSIEEIRYPPNNPYQNNVLMCRTIHRSWSEFHQYFSLIEHKNQYKAIQFIVENYNDVMNLSNFWPILEFSLGLLKSLSFKITRKDAKNKIYDKKFSEKFKINNNKLEEFLKHWNKLSISFSLYGKEYEKKNLDKSNEISYFLIDCDPESNGKLLAAALQNLGLIQNRIKEYCSSENIGKEEFVSFTDLAKDDTLSIELKELEDNIRMCSLYFPGFDQDEKLFYDLNRIERYFKTKIVKAKMINVEIFETIQYQFELFNANKKYSGIVERIRLRYPSTNNEERNQKLRQYDEKFRSYDEKLKLYSWMTRLLNIILEQNENVKTVNEMNKFNLKNDEGDNFDEFLSDVSLDEFINLFEILEDCIYEDLSKEFDNKEQLNQHQKDLLNGFKSKICSNFNIPAFVESHKVLRRIGCRNLTGIIDKDKKIKDYFQNENYWNDKFLSIYRNISIEFPENLKLKHFISVEEEFRKLKDGLAQ